MRFLVTGASGLLGVNLAMHFCSQYALLGLTHTHSLKKAPFPVQAIDLLVEKDVRRIIDQFKPDVLINCAALADLDACEKDPLSAQRLNADLPGWLAEECDRHSIKLVHISTDAVFNGEKKGKYTEEDLPDPLSIYALSKLNGEQNVLEVNSFAIVARVNFFGYSITRQRSLAEVFYHTLKAGKEMFGFTDVIFTPLYVIDLADILLKMIEKQLKGLYHVTSPEAQSKYDFGVGIARRFGLNIDLIRPISVNEAKFLNAPRSQNLALDPSKVEKVLQINLPGQQEGLDHFYQDFKDGYAQCIYQLL